MLKRKITDTLCEWKADPQHKPLIIKGPRQCGKTFSVLDFAKNNYKNIVYLNFFENQSYKDIFAGSLDAESVYKRMTAQIRDIELIPGKTLIFLDEIQNCGNARTAIKFLAEDGRFDIISSGSLLGLTYAEDGDSDQDAGATCAECSHGSGLSES